MIANRYNRHNVKGDGNCLFRAIAISLNFLKTNGEVKLSEKHELEIAIKLRKIAASIVCKNGGENIPQANDSLTYRQWILYELSQKQGDKNELFQNYCKKMKNGNGWGGQVEILALSDYLQIPIVVFEEDEERPVFLAGAKFDTKKFIVLNRVNSNHYHALLPILRSTSTYNNTTPMSNYY